MDEKDRRLQELEARVAADAMRFNQMALYLQSLGTQMGQPPSPDLLFVPPPPPRSTPVSLTSLTMFITLQSLASTSTL